ncbi:unnamed protein product, partial [Meganyctiphanes norvegica]
VDVPDVGPIEWPKLTLVLSKMLYEKQDSSSGDEQIVEKIKIWLKKAISEAGYNEDVKSKLQALLNSILLGVTGKLEKCPNGYVEIGTQCFLMTIEKVTWDTAKTRCEENSLQLASLKDPNALRDYVINNFPKSSFWVGGRYYKNP